jgi:hypothetical protein
MPQPIAIPSSVIVLPLRKVKDCGQFPALLCKWHGRGSQQQAKSASTSWPTAKAWGSKR